LLTISDLKKSDISIKKKKVSFSKKLKSESFFLLIKPTKYIYTSAIDRYLVEKELNRLIKAGFINIEISWSHNENWLDYVSNLRLKFPKLNLGSASVRNKKSIDDSIKIGLNYSMMKGWDRDLLNYSNSKIIY
jgi:2-dehydro-3-deoxyphosphogluconate aldolase/(4S)-4-hydroxy-2-oxoglutarate aldolase